MEDLIRTSVCAFDPSEEYAPRRRRGAKRKSGTDVKRTKKTAFARVVQLCTTRDRSQHELFERLGRDGYNEDEAREAIERAVGCNLVNDVRFADAFVRGRVSAGKGIAGIEFDLLARGIDPQTLPDWPYGYGIDPEGQSQAAMALLIRHPPRSKDLYGGAYRKLVSKGYDANTAASAAKEWARRMRAN